MNQFGKALLTSFWCCNPDRINAVSRKFRAEDAAISLVIDLFKSLSSFLESPRQTFESHEQRAFELVGESSSFNGEKRSKKGEGIPGDGLDDSSVPCSRDARGGEPILMPPSPPGFRLFFQVVDEAQSMAHSVYFPTHILYAPFDMGVLSETNGAKIRWSQLIRVSS